MKTSSTVQLAALAAVFALVGAGCPTSPLSPTNQPPSNQTNPSANGSSDLGFGKLPLPSAGHGTSMPLASAQMTAGAMAMPEAAMPPSDMMMGSAGVATAVPGKTTPSTRPLPIPSPNPKPVSVEYSIDGALPSWGTSSDVLQVEHPLPDPGTVSAFAQNAGLPPQALPSNAEVSTISLQWKDSDSYQWSFDARSRSVSFWSNTNQVMPMANDDKSAKQPTYGKAAIIKAADTFLDAHGFGAIRQSGGMISDQQWAAIMSQTQSGGAGKDAMIYPCPVMLNGTTQSDVVPPMAVSAPMMASGAGGGSAGSGVAVPSIAPMPPCGWWPQQVTVMYGGTRDGKDVVDTYGNPYQADSVTVSIDSYGVMSGNLQLDESVDKASYPLIDQDTAKKRLQSGGQNPVYPWGSETKTIQVHLTKVDVVWMRYDSWQDNDYQTFYLPALRATGTVDRGIKGQSPEPYMTVIPLVADSAFDDQGGATPPPMPMPATGGVMMPMQSMPTTNAPTPESAPGSGPNIY